tara:strand:- start:2215 stop:3237 length:1023 start_codon:yes stop_codon:yes gene_type:complete
LVKIYLLGNNMELIKANIDKDFNKWNDVILNSPDFYTIAHNPSLLKFLENTLKWKGESFFIMDKNEIVAVYQHSCPYDNKSVSMPHFSYGGIIRKDNSYTVIEIFNQIKMSLPKFFEIRGLKPYTDFYNSDKVATFLDLQDTIDGQLAMFKSNHRRKIKKAYKNNLKVTVESTEEAMIEFYKVYTKNMLRLGSPSLSKRFFLGLLKEYAYGDIKVFLVFKEKEIIGGAVLLSYNDFVEDCWLSTLSKYNYLYTSVILYWEMIRFSILEQKKIFSFGRSTKDSSLLNFKRQWKPIEKQLFFSYSEEQKLSLKKMTFLTNLWKLLPLRVANFIGPTIADKLY